MKLAAWGSATLILISSGCKSEKPKDNEPTPVSIPLTSNSKTDGHAPTDDASLTKECDYTPFKNGLLWTKEDPRVVTLLTVPEMQAGRTLGDRFKGRFCKPFTEHVDKLAIGLCSGFALDDEHIVIPYHCFRGMGCDHYRIVKDYVKDRSLDEIRKSAVEIEECYSHTLKPPESDHIYICRVKSLGNIAELTDGDVASLGARNTKVIAKGHPWSLPLARIDGESEGNRLRIDNYSSGSGSALFDDTGRWLGLFTGQDLKESSTNDIAPQCKDGCWSLPECGEPPPPLGYISAQAIVKAWKTNEGEPSCKDGTRAPRLPDIHSCPSPM